MTWLTSYSAAAELTDNFRGRQDHLHLLAAGLLGEAGSIVAEIKKINREAGAYPSYRQRLTEELGDFLWYFVRIISVCDRGLLDNLRPLKENRSSGELDIRAALDLGAAVGRVLSLVQEKQPSELESTLMLVWSTLAVVANRAGVNLEDAGVANLAKVGSRWPVEKSFHGLFDEEYPVEEQIPRSLTIQFLERSNGSRGLVLLRCNAIGIGDRLTDNIADSDGYRYHDIFHIAHAVFLGWSPVVRALLRCKRKSRPEVDENEDGARAVIIEEAVSAIVFSRAKQMRYFESAAQVDYDLLKDIQEFVHGYEVDQVPVWQWEKAILEGYRLFRLLRSTPGGQVTWDLHRRSLDWSPPKRSEAL